MSFAEHSQNEHGFARVYEDRIRPALAELAEHRSQLEANRRRHMRIFGGLVLAALGLLVGARYGLLGPSMGLWQMGLLMLCGAVLVGSFPALLIVWGRPSVQGGAAVRKRLVPIVADHLGLHYDPEATDPPDPTEFGQRGMITRANFAEFADALIARAGGVDAIMLRADFARPGNETAADWHGVLLQAELPAPAPATIRIGGDDDWRLGGGGAPIADLPRSAPAAAADAPDAAAAWLPTAFFDRFEQLRRRFDPDGAGRLRAVIDGTSLRLSIRDPVESVLPVPDPTAGPDEIETVLHRLIADAALPRDVADAFAQRSG